METGETLRVQGDGFSRGLEQGRAMATAIADHYAALLASLSRAGITNPTAHIERLLGETDFETAIELHMPHLLREVEGVAQGSGLPRRNVFALQLLDEEWAFRARTRASRSPDKCSSFAIRDMASEHAWIGQNMDLGVYTDGFQRVVVHEPRDSAPAMLVFTIAGMIALLGVNAAGVGVCVNSLPQLPSGNTGIPVAFMIRRLLEARSADEAAQWCRELPHATNQHYLIADAASIHSLEASCEGVKEYRAPDPNRVVHTNHPLAGREEHPSGETNSSARLRSLQTRLLHEEVDVTAMQAALSAFDDRDHPVCRLAAGDGLINFTTGSMISHLTPGGTAGSAISLGPPSERGYRRYSLA